MSGISRREFLVGAAAAGTGLVMRGTGLAMQSAGGVRGANEQIRVAVAGVNGQGKHLADIFCGIENVRVCAVCDVDKNVLEKERANLSQKGVQIDTYADIRKVLDRKDIDVIVCATPNHWHALMTIWAVQAGKDVYVEKPVCHNVWEGRKMVEAARKYKRIVQAGTHQRSDESLREAIKYLQEGNLGKIKLARGFCYKRRDSIGKVDGPQPTPEGVDYDLWTGPAEMQPLMRKSLHYDWHWIWNTGNGDLGNQGVHEMDICRWVTGHNELPPRVMSMGGRFGYIDDGQTPNTQLVLLDYAERPIIFEVRGLPRKKDDPAMDAYKGIRIGVVVECEGGYFAGGWVYDNAGNKIKQFALDGGGGHVGNFIKAVRSRKVEDLNADIEQGHLSSSLCHIANISYRLGSGRTIEEIKGQIGSNKEAGESCQRLIEHLEANGINLKDNPITAGSWLKMDTRAERFTDGGQVEEASAMLRRNYRKGFVVPEQV